jgi:hypothetical protein
VTRKISYPCRFPADGAAFAAASTCATFSASTAGRAYVRTDRCLFITSNKSTTQIIPFEDPQLAASPTTQVQPGQNAVRSATTLEWS